MYIDINSKKKWRKKKMNTNYNEYPDKKLVFCALCVLGSILGGVVLIVIFIIKGA